MVDNRLKKLANILLTLAEICSSESTRSDGLKKVPSWDSGIFSDSPALARGRKTPDSDAGRNGFSGIRVEIPVNKPLSVFKAC